MMRKWKVAGWIMEWNLGEKKNIEMLRMNGRWSGWMSNELGKAEVVELIQIKPFELLQGLWFPCISSTMSITDTELCNGSIVSS